MKSTNFFTFIISLCLLACSTPNASDIEENRKNITVIEETHTEIEPIKPSIDSSSLVVTVERGAFHYDKFVMKDTLITFYPASEDLKIENDNYNQTSKQIISTQLRNELIKEIMEGDFFNLDTSYSSGTTCNSHLTVTVDFNNQLKKVISEDFERGCPEILKHIEQKIIEMHKKKLIRIILPG